MAAIHAFGNHADAMVDGNEDAGGEARARPGESAAVARRKARLAEQLRANLQRRKQQARARRAGDADDRKGLDDDADASKR